MSRRVPLLLIAGLVLAGCGADARLARQETAARARTCGNLTERREKEPVEVPATKWFSDHVEGRARRTGTGRDQRKSNNEEMKDDCKLARAFAPGSTFDQFMNSVVSAAESPECPRSSGPPPTASGRCVAPGGG